MHPQLSEFHMGLPVSKKSYPIHLFTHSKGTLQQWKAREGLSGSPTENRKKLSQKANVLLTQNRVQPVCVLGGGSAGDAGSPGPYSPRRRLPIPGTITPPTPTTTGSTAAQGDKKKTVLLQ